VPNAEVSSGQKKSEPVQPLRKTAVFTPSAQLVCYKAILSEYILLFQLLKTY